MNDVSRTRWSEAFSRSTLGVAIWNDRKWVGKLKGPEPEHISGMYMPGIARVYYADGGWESYSGYGFSTLGRSGNRIFGWGTLRFLCALHGFEPPQKRLAGEPFVPDTDILVATVRDRLIADSPDNGLKVGLHPVKDRSGSGPVSIDELYKEAADFWLDLKRRHLEAGIPVDWEG